MGLYVYGVTTARPLPAQLHGVGDPPGPVRAVPAGPIAAVVGQAPPTVRAKRRDVQAHQNVLMAIAANAPVLPARFGVIAPDEQAVRGPLERDVEAYLGALDRVAGRIEMNLKVIVSEGGLADMVREDEGLRRLHQETTRRPSYDANIRLGQEVAKGLRRRAAAVCADVLAQVSELAEESVHGPDVDGCVANVSFLIESGRVGAMRRLIGRITREAGSRAELRLTGPLPCYSFCALPAAV